MKINFEQPLSEFVEVDLKALGFDLMLEAAAARQRADALFAAVEEVRAELAARHAPQP